MNSPFTDSTPAATSSTSPTTLAREIRVDRARAADWLNYLEQLPSISGKHCALAQFHQHLSDACWLARWKRENVLFDLDVTLIPGLVSELLAQASRSHNPSDQTVIEEIVASVTRH